MPAYKDGKYVSVPCEGALLARIEAHAAAADVSVAQAAVTLIDRGLSAQDGDASPAATALGDVPADQLAAEVARRLAEPLQDDEALGAALERADAAEGKLASLRAGLAELAR